MWNQNPNFLPNSSLHKANDQFGSRMNPAMLQKLEPSRNLQPWLDSPTNSLGQFQNNQIQPQLMGSGPRQRFPNVSQLNSQHQKFDSRNVRKNEDDNDIEPWLNPPRFQNSSMNFSPFPLQNRQQLVNSYNRFHSSQKKVDAYNFEPDNQQFSAINGQSTPLSNLEKRFCPNTDKALSATKNHFDRLNSTQQRWENKSNQSLDQQFNSGSNTDSTNFQAQSQTFQHQISPNSNSSLNFNQNTNPNMNRFQYPQQGINERFHSGTRPQMSMSRNPPDLMSQQHSNYQYSPVSAAVNKNQNPLNRLSAPQNFQSQYPSIGHPTNANQDSTNLDYLNIPQEGYKNPNNDLQFSDHPPSQQPGYISQNFEEQVSNVPMNEKFSDFPQFCSTEQNFMQQSNLKGNILRQMPVSSSCNEALLVDNFSHHNDKEINMFSPQFKMDNTLPFDPKSSRLNQFDSMQNVHSESNLSHSQDTNLATSSLPQPNFNAELFMNSRSYSDAIGSSSENLHLFTTPDCNNSSPSISRSKDTCNPPSGATDNVVKPSDEMINTQQGLCAPSTLPFPPHNFNNHMFGNSDSCHKNNVPCETNLYSPGVKLDTQILSGTKQFNSSQQIVESTNTVGASTSVAYSSSLQIMGIPQSIENLPQSSCSTNVVYSASLPLPSRGSQLYSPLKPLELSELPTVPCLLSNNTFNRNNSTGEDAFNNKTSLEALDHLSTLSAEHQSSVEEEALSETVTPFPTSQSPVSSANILTNITGDLTKSSMGDLPCDSFSVTEMTLTNQETPNFMDSKANLKLCKQSAINKKLSMVCSLQQPHGTSLFSVYENQAIKNEGSSDSRTLVKLNDDVSEKHVNAGSTKVDNFKSALQSDVSHELMGSDVIHNSSNLCHSSFIDAELKYNAIPFLSEDDYNFELSHKSEEIPFNITDVSDLQKPDAPILKDEMILKTPVSTAEEIKGTSMSHGTKSSNSQKEQTERNEVSADNTKSKASELVASKTTSADLPAFDISQVLSDPKMLNDILHAAKTIQLTEFSQNVAFPSSTSSSSKSIAIVPPMQNDGQTVMSSFSRGTSSKLVDTKKAPTLQFSGPLKMKTEIPEDSPMLTQSFTNDCDIVTSQTNKTFLDIQNSTSQSGDPKYSTHLQNSSTTSQFKRNSKADSEHFKDNNLKRTNSDTFESMSKIQKNNHDLESFDITKTNAESRSSPTLGCESDEVSNQLVSGDLDENATTAELFSTLTQCPINTDEDADLVIKVMSMLFELLLKYKLRDIPEAERMDLIESVRAGHTKKIEKMLTFLQVASLDNESTTTMEEAASKEEHLNENALCTVDVKNDNYLASTSITSTPSTMNTEPTVSLNSPLKTTSVSSETMYIPPLPQLHPAMYSNCPINMPMSFWMTAGAPLMSIPTIPETMPTPQYPPLPPPPLPPPPPPQFLITKPPLPRDKKSSLILPPPPLPQLPMDHPPPPPPNAQFPLH